MKDSDMIILGAAAMVAYMITRGKLKMTTFSGGGISASRPIRPSNAVNLVDANGSTMNTDWVIPGSQQEAMLNAQWSA
jgi:hypothetical protein